MYKSPMKQHILIFYVSMNSLVKGNIKRSCWETSFLKTQNNLGLFSDMQLRFYYLSQKYFVINHKKG